MSFTIGRTYNLVAATDYTPRSAIKFRGTINTGGNEIAVSHIWGLNPITAVATPTMTAPTIIGTGVINRDAVTGTAAGDIIQITNPATTDGTFDYYLVDNAYPSSYDMPIKAFHVLAAPGAFSFITLEGATVTLPAGSLAVGGIYDYSIKEVLTLTNPNTILGLSPEGQRPIY